VDGDRLGCRVNSAWREGDDWSNEVRERLHRSRSREAPAAG
jgi:hypothetical protein